MNGIIKIHTSDLHNLLPEDCDLELSFRKRINLIFRHLMGGYKFYYYAINNHTVGYLFLKKNYLGRYSNIMKPKDWIITPYFVAQEHRNKGIATELLKTVVNDVSDSIYAIVFTDNIASLTALSKVNFENLGYCKTGVFAKITNKKTNTFLLAKSSNE